MKVNSQKLSDTKVKSEKKKEGEGVVEVEKNGDIEDKETKQPVKKSSSHGEKAEGGEGKEGKVVEGVQVVVDKDI